MSVEPGFHLSTHQMVFGNPNYVDRLAMTTGDASIDEANMRSLIRYASRLSLSA